MNLGWLIVALAAVVLGIGGYIAAISLRRKKLERRIAELEDKQDTERRTQ